MSWSDLYTATETQGIGSLFSSMTFPVIENDMLLGMISLGDVAVHGNNYKEEISEALTEISSPTRPTNI